MLSLKTKYAIKALIVLGEERARGGSSLRIEEVAERGGTPKRFLEHILIDLRNGGYIGSRRGRDGGYFLIKEPRQIAIGEVLRLVDGPIAPLPCLSRLAYRRCDDCADEATCRLRKVFGELFAGYLLMLESLTLADLMADDSAIVADAEAATNI
ncbi:Rrf2 family transcriptional regulator [Amaricoccus sp.]|uniref:RrF2 family transcriptional regulator n=1 Tax=Amaricoccus sp. TaxID=1872485 RepID=UPI001B400E00|nr:Rrf2 family transcriptional regulator [Amaricoccus sp.]MBP7241099.1 Rrf2 family transcriptional regulator [Amaricoccus sp.]